MHDFLRNFDVVRLPLLREEKALLLNTKRQRRGKEEEIATPIFNEAEELVETSSQNTKTSLA
jgi:hypothetical protein